MKGGKCVTLTLQQKRDVIAHKHENPSIVMSKLAAWAGNKFKLKVTKSTMSRILRVKEKILNQASTGTVKRVREASLPSLEHLLYQWFLSAQDEKLCISDDLLIEKAKQIYEIMEQKEGKDFRFSNGWLYNFKKRHNISCQVLHGEARSVDLTEEVWDQIVALKARLTDYAPEDIFNFDETALFYKLQPNRTLRDQITKGEKKSKERLSVGLTANSDGTVKFPPLVINRFLHAKGRKKVVLLIDNASSHKWLEIVEKLKVTRVMTLPPNTTARFQPMDVGIIKSFKAQYRRLMMGRMLRDYDQGKKTRLDVYDVVMMLEQAWIVGVTQKTIENCWIHCGLAKYVDNRPNRVPRDLDLNATLNDADLNSQMAALEDILLELGSLDIGVDVNMNADDWLQVDQADPDDLNGANEWLENVLQQAGKEKGPLIEVDIEEVDSEIVMETPIQFLEARIALETVKKYFLNAPMDVFGLLKQIRTMDTWILNYHQSRLNLKTIDSYFSIAI